MTSWRPYFWKELRQNQRLALIVLSTLLALILLPWIIACLFSSKGFNSLRVIFLGGPFLALTAGVCAMGREQGTVEGFWRSLPMETNRWLMSKYLVGLAIVLLVCWTPILIEAFAKSLQASHGVTSEEMMQSAAYGFILLLIYSVSFVLGQCIVGILHAAILAAGAAALIYIVPMVVAPLSWLSIEVLQKADVGTLDGLSFGAFIAGMVIPSGLLLWLGSVLLKRGIQINVERRTLSWSVAVLLLVLATAVLFPMGTNLPAQQVISLPISPEVMVSDIAANGNDVLALVSSGPQRGSASGCKYGLIRIHIDEQNSVVDDPIWLADPGQEHGFYYTAFGLTWPAENPSLAYTLLGQTWLRNGTVAKQTQALYIVALDAEEGNPTVRRLDLISQSGSSVGWWTVSSYQQRLYACDETGHLLTFSLANPESPTLIGNQKMEQRSGREGLGLFRDAPKQYQIQLVPITDMDEAARLEVTRRLDYPLWTMTDPNHVVAYVPEWGSPSHRLILFRTGAMQNNVIPLQPIAQRRSRIIDQFFGLVYGSQVYYMNRLAFQLSDRGVTVYDISNPPYLKRIGHYAAGERFNKMAVLPDNRVVIVGDRLHVLDLSEKVAADSTR